MGVLCPFLLMAQSSVYYRYETYDGKGNTAFGLSLNSNGGTYNVGMGLNALGVNVTGIQNAAVGTDALRFNTTGERNVAVGTSALHNNNAGYNVAVGFVALQANTAGTGNVATGAGALWGNTTGINNVATGFEALHDNNGNYNVATGTVALRSNTTGAFNTAMGAGALYANTTAEFNTAMGAGALYANTTGMGNTAHGFEALHDNAGGWHNVATGYRALRSNTIGGGNVANGIHALYSNTTAYFNTAIGYAALEGNTTGGDNTAIGFRTLKTNTTGGGNTAIGQEADVAYSYLVNATAIGRGAVASWHNRVRIGDFNVTRIEGNVNWSVYSDARMKSKIQNSELGLSFIQKLRPVTYAYKHDSTETIYTGFLAQEVEAAVVASGQKEFSAVLKPQHAKDHYSLRYAEFVVPLVKAVQQQQQIIDKQKEKIETLEQRLKALEIFVKKPVDNATDKVELKAARPNPAKGQVQIDYYLPASATKGVLALFDVSGKRLQTHSIDATGEGSLGLDTKNLAAGVYIYTLQVDGKETVSQKMVVAAE
jgi:hypothetical protein